MIVKILKKVEMDVKTLHVSASVRYWEDATINGVEDEMGDLTPCRVGECWKPVIELETGKVVGWPEGVTASIHFKVCDAGVYEIKDEFGTTCLMIDGYVPKTMCPGGDGYGDYIIMNIAPDGLIANWKPDLKDFFEDK